jgi:4-amino-4-deoxy-L-arabinose transferase-like glycosyltransferase
MESFLGPTGVDPYLVGLLPLGVALIISFVLLKQKSDALSHFRWCSTRIYYSCLGIALLGVLAGFPFLQFGPEAHWDYYFPRALNIVRYGIFGYGNTATAFFPPGYSFLLVPLARVLGDSPWTFFLTNVLLLLGATLVLRCVCRTIDVPIGIANVLSLFLFIYPTRLFSTYVPLSDIPFSLFFMMSCVMYVIFALNPGKGVYLFLAGVFAGGAALIRASGVILFLPLLIGSFFPGGRGAYERVLRLAVLLGGFLVIVLPWTVRNTLMLGHVVLISANGGYNLLAGSNPRGAIFWTDYPDSLLRAVGNPAWNEAERDSFCLARARAHITAHPVSFLVQGGQKVVRALSADSHGLGALRAHTNFFTLVPWLRDVSYGLNNFLYYLFMMLLLDSVRKRWPRWPLSSSCSVCQDTKNLS